MTKDDVLAGVREVCVDVLQVPEAKVTPEARFLEDLDVDSLYLVQIALALEERFKIQVPEDDMANVKTVEDMVEYVLGRVGVA